MSSNFKILIILTIITTIFCDYSVELWFNKTNTVSLTIEGNASSVAFNQENTILFICSGSKIIIWDILKNYTFLINTFNSEVVDILSLNQTTFLFANQTSLFFFNISGCFIEEVYIGEVECLRYLKEDDIILIGSDKAVITYNLKFKIIASTSVGANVVRAIEFLNRDYIVFQCEIEKICISKLSLNNSLEISAKKTININNNNKPYTNVGIIKIVNETLIVYEKYGTLLSKKDYEIWILNESWIGLQGNSSNLSSIEHLFPEKLISSGYLFKNVNLNVLNKNDYYIRIDDTYYFKSNVPITSNILNKYLNLNLFLNTNSQYSVNSNLSNSYFDLSLNSNFQYTIDYDLSNSRVDLLSNTHSQYTTVSEPNLIQIFSFSSVLTKNPQYILTLMSTNIDINDCLLNCSSQGNCKQTNQKFICECFINYAGTSCQLNTLPCASNPCLNNGTCINDSLNKNFSCECLKNENQTSLFYGSFCENKVNICENETCSKNGVCYDINDEAKCKCFKSYTGDKCENETTEIKVIQSVIKASAIIATGILISTYLLVIFSDLSKVFCEKKKNPMVSNKGMKPFYVNK